MNLNRAISTPLALLIVAALAVIVVAWVFSWGGLA